MRRNVRKHRLSLVLFFAVSLILTSVVTAASAADSGTVSGTVEVDGQRMADVEVFLWVGYPRHTCTDSNGEFTFEDVPFDVDLFSATGFGSPENCRNFRFLAPDGSDVITEFYDANDFYVTQAEPEYFVEFMPRKPLPTEKVCAANVATVVGTDGDDVLEAGPGASVVWGGGGDDIIKGTGESFEYLCGGPGRDAIYGFGGGDVLVGGPGLDRLFGGGGADTLLGEGAKDIMNGGAGDDILWGLNGNDKLLGGVGDDIIRGHGGNDAMFGSKGFDRLYGGLGDDKAFGGPGGDTCQAEKKVSCR